MTAGATELPRLLAIMGSGETSPTMVTAHRQLLARLGPPPVPAVLLDTPFGFQANASLLAARAMEYFRESVGIDIEVAAWRASSDVGDLAVERSLARLRAARYVFAGPGSPSYALRQWAGSPVPDALAGKLERGGCITFASAAALTLGVATVPVYEIYKVGEDPHWLEGLDLLARVGLAAAVIPHYDNAEGGNHDTRYCYLGEPRLAAMEEQLPEEVFVLGVDEHTGLVLDLGADTATVVGRGKVTVRRRGRSVEFPTGTTVGVADLRAAAEGGPAASRTAHRAGTAAAGLDREPHEAAPTSLSGTVDQLQQRFERALAVGEVETAVAAVLALDTAVVEWSRDTLQSDQADKARSVLRSMVVRLGELAEAGVSDPEEPVRPFIEALVELRDDARRSRDWATADSLRDRLLAAGVEIRDTAEGTAWRLLS